MARAYRPVLAGFLLLIGVAALAVWALLLFGGEVRGIAERPVAFALHWLSELLLSGVSIGVGLGLLLRRKAAALGSAFALGMGLCSTFHAAFYYLAEQPDLIIASLLWVFFSFALVLTILGVRGAEATGSWGAVLRVEMVAFGVAAYALLNIAGDYGQRGAWPMFANVLLLAAASLFYALRMLVREIRAA